jgi:hypothetical protein
MSIPDLLSSIVTEVCLDVKLGLPPENIKDNILHEVKNHACYKPGVMVPEYHELSTHP